jgi:hypothetical protein
MIMYELIMRANETIVTRINIYAKDFGYIVARGRENGVIVRAYIPNPYGEEYRRDMTLFLPVTCCGSEEDVCWFLNDISELVSKAA